MAWDGMVLHRITSVGWGGMGWREMAWDGIGWRE